MYRIYINKSEIDETLSRITRAQAARNCFVNVAVKPYKGSKYDPENTAVIVIG